VQNPGGRAGTGAPRIFERRPLIILNRFQQLSGGVGADLLRSYLGEELVEAFDQDARNIFAGHRQAVLAGYLRVHTGIGQDGFEIILDEIGLTFLDDEDTAFTSANAVSSSGTSG